MPALPKLPDPKNGNANPDTLAEDGGRRSSLRRDASAEERARKGARVGSSPGGLDSASAGGLGGSVGVPSGSQGDGGVKYPGGNFGSLPTPPPGMDIEPNLLEEQKPEKGLRWERSCKSWKLCISM